MDIFEKVAERIIEEQEGIIGPIALEQAQRVQGLHLDWKKHIVTFDGNDKGAVLEKLVAQYKSLFGQASVEACKEAVRGMIKDIPQNQVPALLQ